MRKKENFQKKIVGGNEGGGRGKLIDCYWQQNFSILQFEKEENPESDERIQLKVRARILHLQNFMFETFWLAVA